MRTVLILPIAHHISAFKSVLPEQRKAWSACGIVLAALFALGAALPSAQAQTLTVLYSFTGGADGEDPVAGLVRDPEGNLYGTTWCENCVSGFGSVFEVYKNGNEITLHSFSGGADGANPSAPLIRDAAGNLYGTTQRGGAYDGGTVFKVDTNDILTVMYSFNGYSGDGAIPFGGLIRDVAGNLYGTTFGGGAYNTLGTIFKLDAEGNETVLHSFDGDDGEYPNSSLVADASFNLYGTAFLGGPHGGGTVFKLDTAGVVTVLGSFGEKSGQPVGVLRDSAGNLYGTTAMGGSTGNGAVYELRGTTGQRGIRYSFGGTPDGAAPNAPLIHDAEGNFYGTTFLGGASGEGTIFKLDRRGKETVLYSFTGGTDGGEPEASLVMDSAGNLYGTTYVGGNTTSCLPPYGCGVVFKLTP